MGDRESERKFRGTWCPVIVGPTFNAFHFLPVPVPMEPRLEMPEKWLMEVPVIEENQVKDPPSDALLTILDRNSEYRAWIGRDGRCETRFGTLLGWLNDNEYEAGSANDEYLGMVEENSFDNVCNVLDAIEEKCGSVDLGTHTIRDCNGATVADISAQGTVTGHNGMYMGQFEGFTFHQMKLVALYLMLVDPGMLSKEEGYE